MRPSDRYTYENAGFNGLMVRSRKSNANANTIKGAATGSGKAVNFSLQQVSGALGDILAIGRINLDGKLGRIGIANEGGTEVVWIGNLVK